MAGNLTAQVRNIAEVTTAVARGDLSRKITVDVRGEILELKNTVYALDSTTIDLCLGLFDWAPFRSTKAAVKMHTLLDLRGSIPAFIHISDGKMHDVQVLDLLTIERKARDMKISRWMLAKRHAKS